MPTAKTLQRPLLAWFEARQRDLPWRRTSDPYAIWISEIMLQQTQVDTVIPYWERFMARFPTVATLAAASKDAVLKSWEGLGYYSRARNMHAAAQVMVSKHGGQVPADPASLRALPGVGAYTAGAVASLAFGLPEPAVDGNVMRVLSRIFARADDVTRPATRKGLEELARSLIPEREASAFNQALMELGALVCAPRNPRCDRCPVAPSCLARERGLQEDLPRKTRKARAPYAAILVALCRREGRVLVSRRPERGLLGGMMGFPTLRLETGADPLLAVSEVLEGVGLKVSGERLVASYAFDFTHLRTTHFAVEVDWVAGEPLPPARWAPIAELGDLAFPTALAGALSALGAQRRTPGKADLQLALFTS